MIFFRLLSHLPFPVLYGISDVLYFFIRYVFRYREQVILENLKRSFPDKSPEDIRLIANDFYRNLTDILVETIKLASISPCELKKRFVYTNPEVIKDFLTAGQTVICTGSHQCNWEWVPSAAVVIGIPVDSVYKPLTSPNMEKIMQEVRASHGAVPTPMNLLPRQMVVRKDIPRVIALVADQVPDVPEQGYWMDFLYRDTPFYPGTERLARSRNLPVFFLELIRVRRGYYEGTFSLIAEPPYKCLSEGAILESYRNKLEKSICKHPSDWLWSHKRWKHWRGKYAKVGAKLT
ncbi:lipid A biosynthesis acyltransferase [Spirosoma sp. KCTC 42546]|uniref:lysophospholipid acyltransferase family protein n=1 Tax=Spirosoma sp. KCTC 42546 TaxID=2520506 RepID=UPI00115C3F61|nr:lysophospholipid acyltransferase family protein [Spirosoma sp. KCTC 42546]QDK79227.1 lipid A biosynthesis acyltransferase [Spirosoma sp. KCTC 42546]